MAVTYPIAAIDISSTKLDGAVLEANGKSQPLVCKNIKAGAKELAKALAQSG